LPDRFSGRLYHRADRRYLGQRHAGRSDAENSRSRHIEPGRQNSYSLSQESVKIVGVVSESLPHLVQDAVEKTKEVMKHV